MSQTYSVQSGDTLSKIAKHFGVTGDAMVKANNIANPNLIKAGQVLKIPENEILDDSLTVSRGNKKTAQKLNSGQSLHSHFSVGG
jgi:LysM repeat protein